MLRCPACRAVLRSRAVDTSGPVPVFDVEVAGQPDTRRRVELDWSPAQRQRLSTWLLVASAPFAMLLYAQPRWAMRWSTSFRVRFPMAT